MFQLMSKSFRPVVSVKQCRLFDQARSSMSHTHLNIPGIGTEESDVRHTPIFSQPILDYLLPVLRENSENNVPTRFLDMTFGTGGHTSLILDHGLHLTDALSVVASDRDRGSFSAAQEMSTRYRAGNLVPLHSRFSQLPKKLSSIGMNQSFDGIIIETGVSNLQWNDSDRGFCPRRKGNLDLRMDEAIEARKIPTASEVLQHIDERNLIRLLKIYGGLKTKASFVAQAILEARFMFHHFKTTQELFDILGSAAHNYCLRPQYSHLNERDVHRDMMEMTVTALRLFVNDELNELDFAIRVVANSYLKCDTGLLFVMVHSPVEEKLVVKCLKEIDVADLSSDQNLSMKEIENLSQPPWKILTGLPPIKLSPAEKTLHPRFSSASLFVAKRLSHN